MKRLQRKEVHRHPFYVDAHGEYRVDEEVARQPEFQPLWKALYQHYEFGANEPLPYEFAQIKLLPLELVRQIVNNDAKIFFHLLSVEKAMYPLLKQLAPEILLIRYPDTFSLLMIASDQALVESIDLLNAVLKKMGRRTFAFPIMGVETRSGIVNEPFATKCQSLLAEGQLEGLGEQWPRSNIGPRRERGEFMLLAQMHTIRICVCLARIGQTHGIKWRDNRMYTSWANFDATLIHRFYSAEDSVQVLLAFARELIDALHNQAKPEESRQFLLINVPPFDQEGGGFSVEAAELNALIHNCENDLAFWREQLKTDKPRFIDAQFFERTVSDICQAAGAERCEQYWINLLRREWERKDPQVSKGLEVPKKKGVDAHCRGCGSLAQGNDPHLNLPLCSDRCYLEIFNQLEAHGLLTSLSR